jgi:hypothetical protein
MADDDTELVQGFISGFISRGGGSIPARTYRIVSDDITVDPREISIHTREQGGDMADMDDIDELFRRLGSVSHRSSTVSGSYRPPHPDIAETDRLHDRGLDVLSDRHLGQARSQAEIVTWLESDAGEEWSFGVIVRADVNMSVFLGGGTGAGSPMNYQEGSFAVFTEPGFFSIKSDDGPMYVVGMRVEGAQMSFSVWDKDSVPYV